MRQVDIFARLLELGYEHDHALTLSFRTEEAMRIIERIENQIKQHGL